MLIQKITISRVMGRCGLKFLKIYEYANFSIIETKGHFLNVEL